MERAHTATPHGEARLEESARVPSRRASEVEPYLFRAAVFFPRAPLFHRNEVLKLKFELPAVDDGLKQTGELVCLDVTAPPLTRRISRRANGRTLISSNSTPKAFLIFLGSWSCKRMRYARNHSPVVERPTLSPTATARSWWSKDYGGGSGPGGGVSQG